MEAKKVSCRPGPKFGQRKRVVADHPFGNKTIYICFSAACVRRDSGAYTWKSTQAGRGVIKSVGKQMDWCPDCKDALFAQSPPRKQQECNEFDLEIGQYETHLRALR